MGTFLLGLVVALLIGAGVYYFMLMDAANQDAAPAREAGGSLDLQVAPRIPESAVMEDGTLD